MTNTDKDSATQTKTSRLRELLSTRTLAIPGAFNALVAMQIERAGYEIAYISGAAVSACRGVPDIGLLALSDMATEAGRIAHSVSIPTIVDADTGYGGPAQVAEAVRLFEGAGLAGMQIEDQEAAKKCGHLAGKQLVPVDEMSAKIEAAVRTKADRNFMIVVRTDARAVEGLEAAIQRAVAYAAAGADALFPEALESAEEFRVFAREIQKRGITVPLIANMTEFGKTPLLSVAEFESLGYRGVLFPVTALRTALQAIERLLVELKLFGSQKDRLHHMMTRRELYSLLRYTDTHER
ncbi:MAG: isocitrate lyase/phosphoenolpyruvate mutase family protein [Nitrospira sp.]|nr:isocitrate lyase/phosphoenolpyruvate mutase family protein [Nitrospira sp.]